MRVHLYTGAQRLVEKSGVGQALHHQKAMLERCGAQVTESWRGAADAVHINTVFPNAVLAALRARLRGETVIYYGHSTMQDFRASFVGSDLLAPLFRRWLCFCYSLGDVIITPSPYAKRLLESYGIKKPIAALSNGVDTAFFAPSTARGARFRRQNYFEAGDKVVLSVGHFMERKGILEYIELARSMPEVDFLWYGATPLWLVPAKVRKAMAHAPANLCFMGYCSQETLRDAYCGADAFVFCSHEETEGIVVLEALACGVPVLVRDIPVYDGWLRDGENAYKAADAARLRSRLAGILDGSLPRCTEAGRKTAEQRSLQAVGRQLCAVYRQAKGERAAILSPV